MKAILYAIWEIVEVTLVAIISVVIIRYFLVQPFLVNGASMEPNFSNNNYLLIDEITYRFRDPERGEVVVFHYPNDPKTFFIKRIVGLPEEGIEIKNGKVFIYNDKNPEGFILKENYLPKDLETIIKKDGKIILKKDQYFVMGDNRNFSFDSREWGAVDYKRIVGVVRFRLWPLNEVMAYSLINEI